MIGTAIQQHLLENGWTPFRINLNRSTFTYKKCYRPDFFSTMPQIHGGECYLYCYWRKDGDGDREHDLTRDIIYGLNEVGKPPTVIAPRPVVDITDITPPDVAETLIHRISDDIMNRILTKYSVEEVMEAMFDHNIVLKP